MSTDEEFRTYANEAMRWAAMANNERDQLALLRLAQTFWNARAQNNNRPPNSEAEAAKRLRDAA